MVAGAALLVATLAAFIPTTCPVDQASPSVIAFHGTADPAVSYDGGSVGGGPGNAIRPETTGGQAYPATDTILDFFDGHARAGDTADDAT